MLLVLFLFSPSSTLGSDESDFYYEPEGVGARVSRYRGSETAVVIPEQLGGLPVISIGFSAFSARPALTSVMIPNGVVTIGSFAFADCTGLTNVTIPHTVRSIQEKTFIGCTGLTSVTIPNSITNIGVMAFLDCTGLTNITIPNGIVTIGDSAFLHCSGLTHVTIPSSITSIGASPFGRCTGLSRIEVDPLNSRFVGLEGVLISKDLSVLLQYPAGKVGSYNIPNSISTIESGAFSGCKGLTTVMIPNGVATIGSGAFSFCQGLTNIAIPASVTTIGGSAFFYCDGLTSITIPTGVTTIEPSTFTFCTGLTNVTIPNSVSAIGSVAFYGCGGLTSVTIPKSITSIEHWAFYGCWGLSRVYFQGPPSTNLGSEVFEQSERATVYYLPGSGGWGPTFGGRPTAPWPPSIRTTAANSGVQGNQFGFDVSWAPGMTVVVEAATHLASPDWFPLQTLTLTNDSIHFTDPQWTSQPVRFYRLRIP